MAKAILSKSSCVVASSIFQLHEQYLAMTKKVAEEILGEMRKEISGNQHDQMDSIVQDVSTRIVE